MILVGSKFGLRSQANLGEDLGKIATAILRSQKFCVKTTIVFEDFEAYRLL